MSAVAACRASIAKHSRSFDLASRLLAPAVRDRAAVVYAWCRRADDAIDLAPPGSEVAALATLERELDGIYAGQPGGDLVTEAFAEVARDCRLPRRYPAELLAGMAMDARGTSYRSWDDLALYAYRVAGTVGLMMCHVMGVKREASLDNAVHLGIAMQVTNICRDVAEDWQRGRLYLPDDLLADCGAGGLRERLGEPFPDEARAPVARVLRILLRHAERHYRSGERGLQDLPWRSALAVRTAQKVYAAIGDRIAAQRFDVTAGRAVVPDARKLGLAAESVGRCALDAPARVLGHLFDRHAISAPSRELPFDAVTRV